MLLKRKSDNLIVKSYFKLSTRGSVLEISETREGNKMTVIWDLTEADSISRH